MRDELELELESALDGLTPIEKALILVSAFRDEFGEEWSISSKGDGGFTITKALPDAKKTL